jgi:hypothetical protein
MRFILVTMSQSYYNIFCKEVLKDYKQCLGITGGDHDFVCIDILNKEWCWCENGFYPFNEDGLKKYQNNKEIKLVDLILSRY